MKGLFIPEITAEMFRNGCLEGIEALMAEGEIYDIEHLTWIPVKFRPLTDEEQEEYPDYCYMADCLMPGDGEEILVSTKYGRVEKDECGFDDGYYLDSGYDWQMDIVAWMPLPEPYKAESEGEE
jgi:hypothetical protein